MKDIVYYKEMQLVYAENIGDLKLSGIISVVPKEGKLETFCLCNTDNARTILHAMDCLGQMEKPFKIVKS